MGTANGAAAPSPLVDTGGIEPSTDNDMLKFMRRQAEIAIETADVIIMVTDVQQRRYRGGRGRGHHAAANPASPWPWPSTSVTPSAPPIRMCTNSTVWALATCFETSAVHGHGTGDLLDWVLEHIPRRMTSEEEDTDVIKVAIVGKPNVGKSSLLNRILGEERVIVSNVAGTTRDAIDSYYENETGKYCFIDTAGMRRKSQGGRCH